MGKEAFMSNTVLREDDAVQENEPFAQRWERVKMRLKATHGELAFKSWLNAMQYEGTEARQILITVPTRFMREWITAHYAEDILRFSKMEDPSLISLDIRVRAANQPMVGAATMLEPVKRPLPDMQPRKPEDRAWTGGTTHLAATIAEPVENAGAPLDPRFTFENFVVGKPNELAHAAARRVAENDKVMQGCNPLFLYGGVGLGKTHLMHAIAWHIRRISPARKVIYLSAEKFMYQFIRALRFKEALAFKEQFRSVDVLMIDDVQFISGKDSTQEEFFHTFNALVDQNKQLIISGDRSPSDLDGIEERVRSRLGWGLVADIHATSYELRLGILQSKIEKMPGVQIPPKVLEFLAHKITSNVRELEGALNRVVAHATFVGKTVTLETTQEVLHDLLRANDRRITIEDIQKQVAGHYNIKVSDMHSARRARAVARPRQVAMYLSKRLTSKSLPEIGRRFGGKDHTTVMHAVKRVEEICKVDNDFAQDVDLLTRMLQN
jgi:chromosomal replication initiator protein